MSARPHFSIVGIPVRVEPIFLVISGLFGLRYADFGIEVVGIWIAASFLSILVHELGHGFALKAFGQPSAIVLHGFGGVTISRRGTALTRARSIVVSVAGALIALALLWLPTRTLLGSEWIRDQPLNLIWFILFLSFQNLWWSLANLLPIRPARWRQRHRRAVRPAPGPADLDRGGHRCGHLGLRQRLRLRGLLRPLPRLQQLAGDPSRAGWCRRQCL